ncbi:diguanylate cyclase [Aeromonas diversa]|uniref:diguanylate cyclase n=1 Tax=Aeromonas diversa TaxID=502790 RepID=UPI0034622C56
MSIYPLGFLLLALTATAGPLSPPQLEQELSAIEQAYLSDDEFRVRVARLQAELPAYPAAQQMRIRRMACWTQPADEIAEYRQASQQADREYGTALAAGDQVAQSEFALCRGWFSQLSGEIAQAKRDYDLAFVLARDAGAKKQKAQALLYRGALSSFQGSPAKGLSDLMSAQRLYDALALSSWYGKVQLDVAATYRRMGLFGVAARQLDEVEGQLPAEGSGALLYELHRQRAMLENGQGHFHAALAALDKARALHKDLSRFEVSLLQLDRAEALLGLGQIAEALHQLNEVGAVFRAEVDPLLNGYWRLLMAQTYIQSGAYQSALEHLAQAEPALRREDNLRYLIKLASLRSLALEGAGQLKAALDEQRLFVALKTHFIDEMQEQSAAWVRGELELARQEAENALLRSRQQLQQQELDLAHERRFWLGLVLVLLMAVGALLVGWLLERNRHMRKLAFTDELTGTQNRRRVLRLGERLMTRARRQGLPFSVLMFDIDHFKRINDNLGHHQGDRVLKWMVACVRYLLRQQDVLGRVGGEEFLLLLPGLELAQAARVAERIRAFVAGRAFPGMGSAVTLSLGCAELKAEDDELSDLIRRADAALYRAKGGGRNRVELDL